MNEPRILLMPLGTGGDSTERMRGALAVAARLGAHLRVLHSNLDPRALVPEDEARLMSRSAMAELRGILDQHAAARIEELYAAFASTCVELGIPLGESITLPGPSASWAVDHGLRSQLVVEHGMLADLVLLARPPDGRATATLQAALLQTGRPLLLIPRRLTAFPLEAVLVAWNRTPEASRSVLQALPLLKLARHVVVATASRDETREPGPERLCDYLAQHGITASAERLDRGKTYKGETLLAAARGHGCDLVVMGSYSKKRFPVSVFGGVTQYMLANADVPLFISH